MRETNDFAGQAADAMSLRWCGNGGGGSGRVVVVMW